MLFSLCEVCFQGHYSVLCLRILIARNPWCPHRYRWSRKNLPEEIKEYKVQVMLIVMTVRPKDAKELQGHVLNPDAIAQMYLELHIQDNPRAGSQILFSVVLSQFIKGPL
ncbi:hypothetical protein SUGI_0806940 [Cryptomeria japonica]|uniref:uncharacterized protein LOC131041646 n=1 Tax=Cryptomeria japonica TaxID=3369 RepID=UPI002414CD13|nr:uncharacterized protein LOC131041646 [Cryptomeria japonica]GLJ39495.1 hypothetical protein SUGI_0806940 [Cryptomeria japonica]